MRATKKRINQLNLLRLLRKLKSEDVRIILHFLNEGGLNTLGELTKNLLYCRCNISPKEKITLKKKLSPYKRAFQKIARKKTNQEQRRRECHYRLVQIYHLNPPPTLFFIMILSAHLQ